MSDLRTAAQQALDDLRDLHANHNITYAGTIAALEAALAQEQPNPPGCDHCNHPLYAATRCRVCGRVTEQAEPVEPAAWIYQNMYTEQEYLVWKKGTGGRNWRPLYTAPPQRKPLTEEEINEIAQTNLGDYRDGEWHLLFARAVERAHGINHSKPE